LLIKHNYQLLDSADMTSVANTADQIEHLIRSVVNQFNNHVFKSIATHH